MSICIRASNEVDIQTMVDLSYIKRRKYEKAQPQFWKYAGKQAEIEQAKWFASIINLDDHIALTATKSNHVVGFIIGKIIEAPKVYDIGGLTLMIDDFCVENEAWLSVGKPLIDQVKLQAKLKGVS